MRCLLEEVSVVERAEGWCVADGPAGPALPVYEIAWSQLWLLFLHRIQVVTLQ